LPPRIRNISPGASGNAATWVLVGFACDGDWAMEGLVAATVKAIMNIHVVDLAMKDFEICLLLKRNDLEVL